MHYLSRIILNFIHINKITIPVDIVFNICFSSDVKQDLNIRILSLLGDEVYNENKEQFIGEYTKKINLYSFHKGIYLLEVETSKEIVVRKVVLN